MKLARLRAKCFFPDANSRAPAATWVGLSAFLGLVTVSSTVTTFSSYEWMGWGRVAFAVLMVVTMLVIIIRRGLNQGQIVSGLVFLFLTLWAIALAIVNDVSAFGPGYIAADTAIIISGMLLISWGIDTPWPDEIAKVFVYFSLFVVGLTGLAGGLFFDSLPRFNLEYGSELIGREEDYSLGLSNFFGLSAIAAALVAMSESTFARTFLYSALAIVFLALSFVGGGRGEVFAAMTTLLITLSSRLPVRRVLGVFLVCLIIVIAVTAMVDVSEFVVFQRFLVLFEGDLSSRDSLLLDVLRLLQQNPQCLIFGCGIGFFQAYYGYDLGLYPHNFLAEAVVVFGLPATILAMFLAARGMTIYWKRMDYVDFLLAFAVFSGIVGLKTNALYSSWFLIASLLSFSWLGFTGNRKPAN